MNTRMQRLVALFMFAIMVWSVEAQIDPRDVPADAPTHLEQEAKYKWTPLHWAVRRGHEDRIRQLIGTGADVEARDFQGRTPLHLAVLSGWDRLVTLLLEQGADVNARDQWGITPLGRAQLLGDIQGWDRVNIQSLLRDAGGSPEQIMPSWK